MIKQPVIEFDDLVEKSLREVRDYMIRDYAYFNSYEVETVNFSDGTSVEEVHFDSIVIKFPTLNDVEEAVEIFIDRYEIKEEA